MARMTGPDCAVMCNLINIHKYMYIHTVDSMSLPSGNPFKCHEEVLSLQPMNMIPPKRFDIFFPRTRGCSEGSKRVQIFL